MRLIHKSGKLWPHLRASRLGAPFRRQHPIAGKFADYCCVPLKLLVEVDGPLHDMARDSIRDHRMNQQGFDVLRFSVQEIDENLEGVISTIYDAVQLRLQRQQVESPRRANAEPDPHLSSPFQGEEP